jgi:hypothetical protein
MTTRQGKRCPRCGQVKPADQFYRRRRSLRLSSYCQPCTRATSRESQSRRADPASAALLRAADRTRQRRRRALRGQPPTGGAAA